MLNALHDLARRWTSAVGRAGAGAAIRYRDAVPGDLVDALETVIVAAAESRQHQSLARALDTIAATLPGWSDTLRRRVPGLVDLIGRILPDHQPTTLLRAALDRLAIALDQTACADLRAAARAAWGDGGRHNLQGKTSHSW